MTTVADVLDGVLRPLFGGPLPVHLRAWDGSELRAADAGAPTVVLHSPDALRRLLWSPGEMGSPAPTSPASSTSRATSRTASGGSGRLLATATWARELRPSTLARAAAAAYRLGAVRRPLPPPASEARPRGRLHSKRRDAQVISHHYDLSNALYTLLLDEHMAYSCALLDQRRPVVHDRGRAAGQARPDLPEARARARRPAARRRVRLGRARRARGQGVRRPGHRHHDLGASSSRSAGNGSPTSGHRAPGRPAAAGLPRRLGVGRQGGPYDAISAIEMGEHVGARNYPIVPRDASPAAAGRGPAAGAADVPRSRPSRRRPVHRVLHRTGHAHAAAARAARPGARGGLRDPRRAGAARALRPDRRGLARRVREPLGRGRRPGRDRAGPGLAALPRRRRARVRAEPDGGRPDPVREDRPPTAAAGCPRPGWAGSRTPRRGTLDDAAMRASHR